MLNKEIEAALNRQITNELFSSYSYAAIAAQFEHDNLNGFAHWMKLQSAEEVDHAKRFYVYINDRGGRVEFDALPKPELSYPTPLAAFEAILRHEQEVTRQIHGLVALAREKEDYATEAFLQWFVTEQVEEEKAANDAIQKLKLVGADPHGFYLVDREFAQRTPAPGV